MSKAPRGWDKVEGGAEVVYFPKRKDEADHITEIKFVALIADYQSEYQVEFSSGRRMTVWCSGNGDVTHADSEPITEAQINEVLKFHYGADSWQEFEVEVFADPAYKAVTTIN